MSAGLHADGVDFTPWPEAFAQRYRDAGYWRGEALGQILQHSAARDPLRVALVCGERRWTYAMLDEEVGRLASGLRQRGIAQGDRVVLQLPNIGEFVLLCFALFRLGALPVFALPAHRRSEIAYFCSFTNAKAYVIADVHGGFDYRTLARDVLADDGVKSAAPDLRVIVVGDAAEFIAFDEVRDNDEAPTPLAPPAASALAFLQLSGGSTGRPKLIPRTHDDYFYSVRASAEICGLSENSVYLCALPVAHNFPMSSPGILGVFHAGGTVVLAPNPSPDTVFPLIEREGVTLTSLVPPLAMIWMEAAAAQTAAKRYDLSTLELLQVGGSRLSDEAAQRVRPLLGCTLQQVFGMAEGLVNYTRFDDPEQLVVSTQGRPISQDDEVRVVDDDDNDVAPGELGHLLTRGPYTIRGYYRADVHNARAFTRDGFYRTGDLVRQLPSGHLIVDGRAKDQINRGGDKVAAEEVENHLLAHPAVLDAAVVAMPDAYLGERSCAFIVPRGDAPRAMEISRFMRERGLAQYKVPDRIEFVASFPKTGVGKIDKRALRERFVAQPTTIPV
ncbi:(2,3-dihydroxybenzoyl)adenylate synthase [Uliginosibacterium sp. H3]|uniref:(2,3-dihydroxybenzoyl)adenylate synthase n=1 Tax=Uliginosibacterium silvisoli TaxID=3114758 RepID=A0ABU6K1N2_9RHOO|nr:(2,3-dihydroxybenzoyl)adenylate synthase [Uliginosibacterium sp. H3]